MNPVYRCGSEKRRAGILNPPSGAVLNGIDYLEVIDQVPVPGMPRQRTLLLHLFRDAPTTLGPSNVRISGGVRVRAVRALWVARADTVPAALVSPPEQAHYAALPDATRVLVVRTNVEGDFATYAISLVSGGGSSEAPAGFDPVLSAVAFGFKVECPTDFDCTESACAAPALAAAPSIDYLAKDYQSLRRALLDRLALTLPDFRANPADPLLTALETLCYAGDHLSYHQDAVATEAYLGTARRRISVRRHARMLDYRMHEGACARAWVIVKVDSPLAVTPENAKFFATEARTVLLSERELAELEKKPLVFEPLHAATLRPSRNVIRFYTWGDQDCCLPQGATNATLRIEPADPLTLESGDVLIFEQRKGPPNWLEAEADPSRRHAVRLSHVEPRVDPWSGQSVLDVRWHLADALPFPLCISASAPSGPVDDVSVAYGNVVLVQHGLSLGPQVLPPPDGRRYRPVLDAHGISHSERFEPERARERAAHHATRVEPRRAVAQVRLDGPDGPWRAVGDLLSSSPTANDFVVELDDEGRATLRFGDGRLGRLPIAGLSASYRAGRGEVGNVGRDTIKHARIVGIAAGNSPVSELRNPLPATGGADPEATKDVKLYAPQAFRRNERAVSEADYARWAEAFPDVQRAAAVRRWTGSWYTMLVVVDRKGGRPLDDEFRTGLLAHLQRYRLAGFDLELSEPVYVPLDLNLAICVAPGFLAADVKKGLLERFSSVSLASGDRGFFHPDRLSFGQPIFLSQIVATAMQVPGVEWVNTRDPRVRFQRFGMAPAGELERQLISMGSMEIARLDNSANFPENGRLSFELEGGRGEPS